MRIAITSSRNVLRLDLSCALGTGLYKLIRRKRQIVCLHRLWSQMLASFWVSAFAFPSSNIIGICCHDFQGRKPSTLGLVREFQMTFAVILIRLLWCFFSMATPSAERRKLSPPKKQKCWEILVSLCALILAYYHSTTFSCWHHRGLVDLLWYSCLVSSQFLTQHSAGYIFPGICAFLAMNLKWWCLRSFYLSQAPRKTEQWSSGGSHRVPCRPAKIWSAIPVTLALSKGQEKSQPSKWSQPSGREAIFSTAHAVVKRPFIRYSQIENAINRVSLAIASRERTQLECLWHQVMHI